MTDVEHAEDTRRAIERDEHERAEPSLPPLVPPAARETLERMMRREFDEDDAVTAAGVTLDWLTDLEDDRVLAAAGIRYDDASERLWPAGAADPLPGWAIAEFYGHIRLGAWVSEEVRFGKAWVRLDIPGADPKQPAVTQWRNPSAVFCLTPCDEKTARAEARGYRPAPATRLALAGGPTGDPDGDEPPW